MSPSCWCCVLPGLRLGPGAGREAAPGSGGSRYSAFVVGVVGLQELGRAPPLALSLLGVPEVVAPSRCSYSAISVQSSSLCLPFLYGLTFFYEVPFPHKLAREIYLSSKAKLH